MNTKSRINLLVVIFAMLLFFLVSCEKTTPGAEEQSGDNLAGFIYDTSITNIDGICSSSTVDITNNFVLNSEITASIHNENTAFSCDTNDWLIISTEDKLNWVSVWNGSTLMYNQSVINLDETVTYCGTYTHICVNPTFGVRWDITSSKDRVETIYSP